MSSFAGTFNLVRLALRRDRVRIPVWIITIAGFLILTAASFPELYHTAAERQARAALMTNPAATALGGPGHGLEDYTFGAMMANEMLGFTMIFVALMSVLLVVRHTRAEEASGSAELVRANVVGRHASTAAALVAVGLTNSVLGGVIAVGIGSLGIESMGWAGSLLFGASVAAAGLAFTGVAALASQVTEHARGAAGIAGAAIAVAFSLRAAGDMGDGTLSWLSPFGWSQATMVFVNNHWWPLVLSVGLAVACTMAAMALSTRRDVGAGLVASRPGRAMAAKHLSTPFGVARRLQRASFAWWAVGLGAFGLGYGSLVGEVESFIEELAFSETFFGAAQGAVLLDAFFAMIISMLAMAGAAYVVLTVLRLRSEEVSGRAEPLLATAVSRARWAASHLLIALVGGAILLLFATLCLVVSAAATLGDAGVIPKMLGAALAYVPVLWLFAGIALALFGLVPRAVSLVWVVLVYGMTVGMLGGLLGLPDWTYDLSPFAHVPLLPAEEFAILPLVGLTVVAAGLIAAGLAGFRRRDVART